MTDHDDEVGSEGNGNAPTEAAPANGLILIVEDDEDTRESLRDILQDRGYDVAEAGHGKEALAWLAGGMRPCLILLDIMMPVMTGLEFLEVLRRDPDQAATPVVLVSAWPERAAQAEGIHGYLRKPFSLSALFTYTTRFCVS